MATHFQKLTIADIRRETEDTVSIAFDIPDDLRSAFTFLQGQNITVRMRLGEEDIRRSYSICSSPFDNELRIAVKKVPGGLFSSYANDTLKPGDTLEVLPPTGKFYTPLDPAQARHYLAFAAGSGITPILSLVKTTLATEPGSHFTLVYGNRSRPSIIFREELEALKNRYMHRLSLHHILSREKTDSHLHQGRIDIPKAEQLTARLIDLKTVDEIFLCGPAEMIFGLREWLEHKGVEKKKIHFELFNTQGDQTQTGRAAASGSIPLASDPSAKVTLRLDGTHYEFELPYDGEPVLQAALQQGIDLPYACKGGVCCTCRARLQEGKVDMDLNYALEEDELAQGFILTCQAHPRTPRIIVDFDSK